MAKYPIPNFPAPKSSTATPGAGNRVVDAVKNAVNNPTLRKVVGVATDVADLVVPVKTAYRMVKAETEKIGNAKQKDMRLSSAERTFIRSISEVPEVKQALADVLRAGKNITPADKTFYALTQKQTRFNETIATQIAHSILAHPEILEVVDKNFVAGSKNLGEILDDIRYKFEA